MSVPLGVNIVTGGVGGFIRGQLKAINFSTLHSAQLSPSHEPPPHSPPLLSQTLFIMESAFVIVGFQEEIPMSVKDRVSVKAISHLTQNTELGKKNLD